jgi:hypothetical protein
MLSRWEQYQIEEEASLGRGKRLRKAVSYRETFATLPNEALSEVFSCWTNLFVHIPYFSSGSIDDPFAVLLLFFSRKTQEDCVSDIY